MVAAVIVTLGVIVVVAIAFSLVLQSELWGEERSWPRGTAKPGQHLLCELVLAAAVHDGAAQEWPLESWRG